MFRTGLGDKMRFRRLKPVAAPRVPSWVVASKVCLMVLRSEPGKYSAYRFRFLLLGGSNSGGETSRDLAGLLKSRGAFSEMKSSFDSESESLHWDMSSDSTSGDGSLSSSSSSKTVSTRGVVLGGGVSGFIAAAVVSWSTGCSGAVVVRSGDLIFWLRRVGLIASSVVVRPLGVVVA
jgi:hypothetical protein